MAQPRPGTLEQLAVAAPDQLVLVEHGTGRTRTRAELDERAGRLAAALADRHRATHGTRVAVHADAPSVEVLELGLALAKLGAIPVPVPRAVTGDELRMLLDAVGVELVFEAVGDGATADALPLGATEYESLLAGAPPGPYPLSGFRTAPANLLTSAGTPTRLVERVDDRTRHADLAAAAGDLLSRARHRPSRGHLVAAPVWLPATLLHANVTLLAGGALVLLPDDAPDAWLDALAEHGPGTAVLTPAQVAALLALPAATREAADTTALDALLVAGDHLPLPHRLAAADLLGEDAVVPLYATAECGPVAALDGDLTTTDPGTAGRPLQAITVEIHDAAGRGVPRGTPGTVHVRSPLASGGAAAAGDHGLRDDEGRLVVLGRGAATWSAADGRIVGTLALEDALLGDEALAAAAVTAGADGRLSACVEPRPGAAPDPQALRERVRDALGPDAVPATVEVLAALPRDRLGRVVRQVAGAAASV